MGKRVRHRCGYALCAEVREVFGPEWTALVRDLGVLIPEEGRVVVNYRDPATSVLVSQCPGCGGMLRLWWPLGEERR